MNVPPVGGLPVKRAVDEFATAKKLNPGLYFMSLGFTRLVALPWSYWLGDAFFRLPAGKTSIEERLEPLMLAPGPALTTATWLAVFGFGPAASADAPVDAINAVAASVPASLARSGERLDAGCADPCSFPPMVTIFNLP